MTSSMRHFLRLRKLPPALLFCSILFLQTPVTGEDRPPEPVDFTLILRGYPTPIWVSSQDFAGVRRAVNSFRADLGKVAGRTPGLFTDSLPANLGVVVVGTIGKSPLIDQLIAQNKLDVSNVRNR